MMPAHPRVLDHFPTPIAYTYGLIFDDGRDASVRRWALAYCEYQLLRSVALPMVGQYLRADLGGVDFARDKAAEAAVKALNTNIAGIRAPFFSDWIALVETFRRRLPALGLRPIFPDLDRALDALKGRSAHEFALPNQPELDPLRAILALRNAKAHGATPDEDAAARHIDAYLPVLHQVLGAFDALADCRLLVLEPGGPDPGSGSALVRELRGSRPSPASIIELSDELIDGFRESPAVFHAPDGRVEPLYPLLHPVPEGRPEDDRETIYLYDGHHGSRVSIKGEAVEKGHVHYLGVHHRVLDSPACARMKELLTLRRIDFFLPKEKVAPWTIAETAADYSRNLTLAEMRGTKYLPECYVPFPELERHFDAFLAARPPRSGFVLAGLSGNGKSAFLAHRVARLLDPPGAAETLQDRDDRDNPNLVFFLRGSGIARREDGISLCRDVAEKLGLSTRPGDGIATFGELLDHLNARWKQDRIADRRLILVIDGLNEAPEPKLVLKQALEMIRLASRFPWCKVAVSTRLEWLDVWGSKGEAHEPSDLELTRACLYYDETRDRPGQPAPPTVGLDPFAADQAAEVYVRYQSNARAGGDRSIPACQTPWADLGDTTRTLLANPLYLHLFMETFDGRPAEEVSTVPALFRRFVDRAVRERPGLLNAIEAVIGHIRSNPARPSADLDDDDVNTIREAWARTLTVEERSIRLHPVEDLAHEGWVHKRLREEGGGYRFTFQAVVEYLVYLDLLRARPRDEDELAYWTRRVVPAPIFPEYAGAFTFLFRDWATREALGLAARIVETSPPWFHEVLKGFLNEQARIGHAPGQASPQAAATARMLAGAGGKRTALALYAAGYEIASTHLTHEAIVFYQASLEIREALWATNPGHSDIGDGLASSLNNLGVLLKRSGEAEAEPAYRRAVAIREALWAANPDHLDIGDGLAMSLTNLGLLLVESGRAAEAEPAYRRAVATLEALRAANPDHIGIGSGLAMSLTNLGLLLVESGRAAEAGPTYRRAVAIREALWEANPGHVDIGSGLAMSLNNLGNLLRRSGLVAEAEPALRRAVATFEALRAANPDHLDIGHGLASALNNLGFLLDASGRAAEAESPYRRSVATFEALRAANPDHLDMGSALARSLNNLGNLLKESGLVAEAEPVYRRAVATLEALRAANPGRLDIGEGLAGSLKNLGSLLAESGLMAEAEPAYRRAIATYESLWAANPDHVAIGDGLAGSLTSLGNLHLQSGRAAEAEPAYRRAVAIREALWEANPGHVDIGSGLAMSLNNLGVLLVELGRAAEAWQPYRQAIATYEALRLANSDHVGLKAGLAGTLCGLRRHVEALRLVEEVLSVLPGHPHANAVKRLIKSRMTPGK